MLGQQRGGVNVMEKVPGWTSKLIHDLAQHLEVPRSRVE
jgi:hypothetical protein